MRPIKYLRTRRIAARRNRREPPLPPPRAPPWSRTPSSSLPAARKEGSWSGGDRRGRLRYHRGVVEDVGAGERKVGKDEKNKKRKRGDYGQSLGGAGAGDLAAESVEEGEEGEKKAKRKRNRKKRKVKNKEKDAESKEDVADDNVEDMQDDNDNMQQDNNEELILGEDEVYAWLELRLHPLLIKAMRRLGFKESTPIQKACFPAAAHQGKDVIGAAETGSGKTLAFGLPILQRLLEEREKATRLHREDEKEAEESSRGGPLRALILTPTRELAKQVCEHLKEAAKFLGIQVVPIVGGLSMEKQERLLKKKPEIVVGTPGRLWELMSTGNQHLVEVIRMIGLAAVIFFLAVISWSRRG